MDRISFTEAAEFLAERLRAGAPMRRVGIVVRASLEGMSDAGKRLDEVVQSAAARVNAALSKRLADLGDETQRDALRLSYAGSLRLPVVEQLEILNRSRQAESVTTAAARQEPCPVEVQRFLVEHCFQHRTAMVALAQKRDADLKSLRELSRHPDRDVRISVAANIGASMRLVEPQRTEEKLAVYNSLLHRYESDFAQLLVPVCRDGEQIAHMYARTTTTPNNGRLFVENPYTPDDVLLDISTSMRIRVMPGGSAVASEAKQQVEKRLSHDSEATPEPY